MFWNFILTLVSQWPQFTIWGDCVTRACLMQLRMCVSRVRWVSDARCAPLPASFNLQMGTLHVQFRDCRCESRSLSYSSAANYWVLLFAQHPSLLWFVMFCALHSVLGSLLLVSLVFDSARAMPLTRPLRPSTHPLVTQWPQCCSIYWCYLVICVILGLCPLAKSRAGKRWAAARVQCTRKVVSRCVVTNEGS